jgi:hypothetical protein
MAPAYIFNRATGAGRTRFLSRVLSETSAGTESPIRHH